ncbi:sensor histidine kinase [Enhygromyxa salina]|uniref:sensor histidine kinase n=1 Tax=Enhygromyxa salina TaxID=215803 RepID=UPI0015E5F3E8|nr:ATP-binding protein [Enhygromyxa salina]
MFKTSDKRRASPSQRLRVGFVLVGLTFAAVLLAVTGSSFLGARGLSEAVTRGQAAVIRSGLSDVQHGWVRNPSQADLEALVADLEQLDLGVRYVGLSYPDDPGPEVGEPTHMPTDHEMRALVREGVVEYGEIVQVVVPLAPGAHGDRPPPDGAQRDRPRRAGPPGPPPPDGHLIVEFEPVMRAELQARSRRELSVGIAGALVMAIASLVFWRMSLDAESSQHKLQSQRQLATLGEMSAVLAHELRNPLASLKGHAQLLQERLDRDHADEHTRAKAGRVVAEARRLEDLTHGLLAFVRVGEIIREQASPTAIVESAAVDLERERVKIHAEAAPPSWALDGQRMQQVLANLIDNALQASEDQPVTVEISRRGGALEFIVRDRGPGIPPDQRERIFEPFHTTRTQGTGLGLAVSRRIVELHDGELTVGDNPGGGAAFTVRVPRGEETTKT